MATFTPNDVRRAMAQLRWPLRWTRLGMIAETLVQSFWPLMTVVLLVLAALMLGLHDVVSVETVWTGAVLAVLAAAGSIVYAARRFGWPSRDAAMARLDASLPGRPITALLDEQVIGAGDGASASVWRAHQQRMADRTAEAKPVPADLRVASRDPYALRFVAVLAFAVALIFGSIWRVSSVAELAPGGGGLASGPVWEGWAEPPRYTGRPTLYLNDLDPGALELPVGTLITIRLYGEVGALTLAETVSGRVEEVPAASAPVQDFKVTQDGRIAVSGAGGRAWDVTLRPDMPPEVEVTGLPDVSAMGEMRLPFAALDDYGVEAGEARIRLDLAAVDRRYGLVPDPEPRPEIVVPLPLPISGSRAAFEETLIDDFSEHPWANLPVEITLSVLDASEQQASSEPSKLVLPGRRFFDPMAAAVIEMRRDLLWSRQNARRISQVLRAVSHLPQDAFRSQTSALRLRRQVNRIEVRLNLGIDDTAQADIARALWDLALELEDGDLADALERMRRAQDRLNEAMKNGASDEEIAELMQELRRATEEYMQQLRRQQAQDGQQQQQPSGESMQMTQDDLQRMMDRIQELMEEGRMAEAEEALRQLQELMENMRIAEGQNGEGGQSPGQEALEDLEETLRNQQGLSDQAFRDLQEQFNPGAEAGENQGNEGRNGGQGRGQSHEGRNGQGQGNGDRDGNPGQGQRGDGQGNQMPGEGSLADRQQALREELRRQQGQLPGQGTPEGDAARESLGRAGDAMDEAEEALRQRDLAEALDNQSQAMEALREGMRSLREALAQEQQNLQPGQGSTESDRRANNRDPLGREQGSDGAVGSDEELALDDDAYGRARELLDEIRRRSGETERSEVERDYLRRLLDRF